MSTMYQYSCTEQEWQKYIDKVSETDGFDVDGVQFKNLPKPLRPNSIIQPYAIDDQEVVACAKYAVDDHNSKNKHEYLVLQTIVKVTKQCTILGCHYRITFRASKKGSGSISEIYQARVLADWPRNGIERKRHVCFVRPQSCNVDNASLPRKEEKKRKSDNATPRRSSPRLMEMKMVAIANNRAKAD